MAETRFTLFGTAIGQCALTWRGGRLTGVFLPALNDAAERRAIEKRAKGSTASAPAPFVVRAIDRINRLCSGEAVTFEDTPLERSSIEPLCNRIYDILLCVPFGKTTTYGAIAEELGDKSLSRAVGAAMGSNPFPIIIPCHRVTGAGGKLGGFSAPGGASAKRQLLEIEGAFAVETLPLFGG